MKTALTQLIEDVSSMAQGLNEDELLAYFNRRAKELLKSEKEQIIDASVQANLRYDTGANEPVLLRYCNDAEQYYQQTFKSDE